MEFGVKIRELENEN